MSKVSAHQQQSNNPLRSGRIAAPLRRDTASALHEALALTRAEPSPERGQLANFAKELESDTRKYYDSYLLSDSPHSPLKIEVVPPSYSADSPTLMGFEVINACFDMALAREPRLVAFGEDVGQLGDVNQGFRGMQEKYGALRVTDTGIREDTILGQAIGRRCAGCAPIAEINTRIISCTRCRPPPTTWPTCAGAPPANSTRRSSSARAATGWRACGIPAR